MEALKLMRAMYIVTILIKKKAADNILKPAKQDLKAAMQ